jgi:hypothetical protein
MMNQDQLSGLLFFVLVAVSAYMFRVRVRNRKRIVITDFRRGVHFVGGVFKAVLGPGSYTYNARREQITIVDMRAQPIVIERLPFQDVLRHEGVISIGTELLVREPHLAATALRDQVKDSFAIVRETIRRVMTTQVAANHENSEAVGEAIKVAVNADLANVGIGVSEIEVTELWSPLSPPQSLRAAEIIQ